MAQRQTDVLVVGGGPVGACAALEVARSGAQVALIEREESICPRVSGAHANCGLIAPSFVEPLAAPGALGQGLRWLLDGTSPFYIAPRPSPSLASWLLQFRAACRPGPADASMPVLRDLHVKSARMHDELGREHGDRWHYRQNGELQIFESDEGLQAALAGVDKAAPLGVRAETLSPQEVRDRLPGLSGSVVGGVLHPEEGHLDPALFTREVAALAESAGARVQTGTEALAIDASGSAVRVTTTRGDISADQVVLASGAWSAALARDVGLRLPIQPAKGYSIDLERPDGFPELPVYVSEAHMVVTPLPGALRLGGTLELTGWDLRVRPKRLLGLRRAAERTFGLGAAHPVRQIWRGPRPVTPDGLPVVGRAPRHERVILATGHCMLGLSLAPYTGRLVAQLAAGDAPSSDLSPLSPRRFGLL